MEVEGVGERCPTPMRVRVSAGIVSECAGWARDCAAYRGYTTSRGVWAGGLRGPMTMFGGIRTERVWTGIALGKVAEWCVASLFGVRVDLVFRAGGDGGIDLALPCGAAQVKNTTRIGPMLVKVGSRELSVAQFFIYTKWDGLEEFVSVLGYANRSSVLLSPQLPGIGGWMNYSVNASSLLPIRSLLRVRPIREVL